MNFRASAVKHDESVKRKEGIHGNPARESAEYLMGPILPKGGRRGEKLITRTQKWSYSKARKLGRIRMQMTSFFQQKDQRSHMGRLRGGRWSKLARGRVTLAYITFIPVASTVLLGGLFLIITHLKFFSLSKRHRVGRPFMFQLFRTNAKFV